MTWVIAVVAAVIVAGAALVLIARSRRTPDGVTSFQRHIDALSPEARRSVVDRIQPRHPQADTGAEPRVGDDGGLDGP